ncbi:MAG: AI-2E family transporter [Candidatus Gracilibacteria bacterium]|nr:AI-2E family transporter [Candidatus Gracilibacteria bacterium]
MRLPFIFKLVFNRYFFQKLFAILLLALLIYLLESFLAIFLITFLFSYLFLDVSKTIHEKLGQLSTHLKHRFSKKFLRTFSSLPVIITIVYVSFIVIVVSLFYTLIPHLLEEGKGLIHDAPAIADQVQNAIANFEDTVNIDLGINKTLSSIFNPTSVENIVRGTFENIKNIGIFLTKFLIAMILSYVFLIDRTKITTYLESIKKGNFSFIYEEYSVIFGKIAQGFGLIFKAQAFIALANALLTVASLIAISFFHGGETFPYIITLGVIVFIFGFVPILGTFLSAIPILIIGYNYGGGNVILSIVTMLVFIHTIEAYYLNPRIVSSYMELPVFLTFLILLVSENLFGFVGLLIGVPIFYILIDLLKDFDHFVTKIRHASEVLSETKVETKESIQSGIRLSRSGKRGE